MVGSESVLETRVGSAGINEVRPSQLPNVSQSLEDFGVDKVEGKLVDADVVPDGVAQYLEMHGPGRVILSDRRS